MKNYWRALLIATFCTWWNLHDTFPRRTGTCKRCHLPIGANGKAVI